MHTRRKFLKKSIGAGAAAWMQPLSPLLSTFPAPEKITAAMLKIFATNWGFQGTLDEYGAKAKETGYDGIEIWWPGGSESQQDLFRMLKKYELDVGFLCGVGTPDFDIHKKQFEQMLRAAALNGIQKPVYINCHSGRDYFSMEQNMQLIDITKAASDETGINIYHETHRSRMLFAAPVARQYFDKRIDFQITLDISHWYNVSESLLEDQEETVAMAIDRTGHIHARIGHPEGPQVNDPRAPEWSHAFQAHLSCWDAVAERKKKAGEVMTILTEFGPPDYMPTVPYTHQPLADQWGINAYMLDFLRKRYKA